MSGPTRAAQAALLILSVASAAGAAERAGRATAVQQDALQAQGAVGFAVATGDDIFRQARVYTKQYGTMEIRLEDGTNLTVAPNASLVIDDYVFAGESRPGTLGLSLTRGALRMVSGRMPAAGVSVKTPVATIGVRGTAFWLDAAGDATRIWVDEGTVTAQPVSSATVYEFPAPAYAACSASGCELGAAPPIPTTNPLGGGAGGGGGFGGVDVDRAYGEYGHDFGSPGLDGPSSGL